MQEKRVDIFRILKAENKLTKVYIYPIIKNEIDPIDHEKGESILNPVIIPAIIRQISPEAVVWKYWGNLDMDSLEIIAPIKYYENFRNASKIIINDTEYKTLFDDRKGFSILKRNDYIICVVTRKIFED